MRGSIIIAIILMVYSLYSSFVPLEKAKKVAENYYTNYCAEAASKGSSVVNVLENKYEGIITRYTFEFDKGFVIVTADDELYPILGYSDHGKVPSKDAKGGQNFKEWFDNYDKQIISAGRSKYSDPNSIKLWKDIENNIFSSSKAGVIVDRLVKSQWGINYPWNTSCPLMPVSGMQTETGCVANAMAQILRYHKWPDVGVGSASYIWYSSEVVNIVLSADFTTHAWNYDLMPEILNIEYGLYPEYWETGITQAEKDEMSLLAYWTGLSVDMSYGTEIDGGSAAYASNVDNAFLDHWKASSSVYVTMATPALWGVDTRFDTIKAELDAKRPWFWAGTTWAFILDGYRDDYWYHFNWGWEGNYDGWFHRSYLVPGIMQDGDYSSGQLGITYVPSSDPFSAWPATNLNGSLLNGEDISLSWTACTGATGYEIYRTVDKAGTPTLLSTTTGLTFNDNDLPAGEYAYHIITKYSDGESHNSNSYSQQITAVTEHPQVLYLKAESVGRTNIDLTWTKPFTDILYHYVNFENPYGTLPTGWLKKTSYSPNNGSSWTDDNINYWISIYHKDDLVNWFYQDRVESYCLLMSAAATQTLWLLSPPVTFEEGSYIKWWNRFRYSDDSGVPVSQRPVFQIVSYSGDFSEERRETNIVYTQHALYDGNVSPENIWEYEETCDLSALDSTTTRVGFRVAVNTNDMYTLAFDKITIASSEPSIIEDCTGYEIYRNGILATTISNGSTDNWSDTGFADGENTYYIRSLYPTGTSIPSDYVTATIDANPKPHDLSGPEDLYTDLILNWYSPYYNPPKWYSYYLPENSTTTIDVLSDSTPIVKRRTLFKAEDMGFYYPVTLDSVAAAFYDHDEANWSGQNQFIFRVITGDPLDPSVLYTSPVQTAIHNKTSLNALPTPLILSEPWNVEVITLNSSGYPGTLAGISTTGQTHSFYEYDPGSGASYNYYLTDGKNKYEWLHMSYVTSSDPDLIQKSCWTSASTELNDLGMEIDKSKVVKSSINSFKGLDYYKIYKDGVVVGTSTTTQYEASTAYSGEAVFYVTAYYVDPVGESAPSNEIICYGSNPPTPEPPINVVISYSNGEVHLEWQDYSAPYNYYIYTSDDPYGTFTLLASTLFENEYTYTPTENKKFFYITCIYYCKEAPNTILVPEKVEK